MAKKPKFDVIIFGATSFVGDIITAYMMKQYGVSGKVAWAVAGRSESKLAALKEKHGAEALDHIIADASDETALKQMVTQAKVILSTVGPYALYGEPLVKACVEAGTDYCDLAGEVQWYKCMMDKYAATAEKTGARIVHCSGYDSIPSDMGVYYLQQHAQEKLGSYCNQVDMRVKKIKGAASGGTIASMINITKEAVKDPALRKELANPYSICPADHDFTVRQDNISGAVFDGDYDAWIAPFVMAAVNTRVVHRTNALMDNAYGTDFKYSEAMIMGKGSKGKSRARMLSFGLGAFMVSAALPPTRWVLEKFVVTKPGDGPSPEDQENGLYDMRFIGKTKEGGQIKVKVYGDKDPGYGSTAKIISEAALCLAGLPKKDKAGGFWTPASAFGQSLIDNLTAHAGLTFEVLDD